MKKALTAAALFLALCLCLTAALASGGEAGDPLVSLSYLEGTYSKALDEAIGLRLDESDQAVRNAVGRMDRSGQAGSAALNEGDVLSGSAGMAFTLLGGEVRLDVSGGAVVDVTEGREADAGLLTKGHRYLAAEDASVQFTVVSPAAVASWEGGGVLVPSDGPDYCAIAAALRTLGLFRGSGSGIGEGFDLYLEPTRGEALVMFIRLLGEEDEALACTDGHPFADVPAWLDPYVAWAWRQGYSNGVSDTAFDPDRPVSAQEYVELLLRALGYSAAGEYDYMTSLDRAADCGALTRGESSFLAGVPFRRAHVAYISYYSLDAAVSGAEQTLAQRLAAAGRLTERQLADARSGVESLRLA